MTTYQHLDPVEQQTNNFESKQNNFDTWKKYENVVCKTAAI